MPTAEGDATNVIFSQNIREGIAPAVVVKFETINEIPVGKSIEMFQL
jgi:hypothetical protein